MARIFDYVIAHKSLSDLSCIMCANDEEERFFLETPDRKEFDIPDWLVNILDRILVDCNKIVDEVLNKNIDISSNKD